VYILHSHTAANGLRVQMDICHLDLCNKGQNASTYFSVFQFQYAGDLT